MVISFMVAVYFQFIHEGLGFSPVHPSLMLVFGVAITTVVWLTVTMLTPPDRVETLQSFYDKIHPIGLGWRKAVNVIPSTGRDSVTAALLCWFFGLVMIYGALFGTGYFIYGSIGIGLICAALVIVAGFALFNTLPKVGFE
ncbi:MAG: hypothetical protein P8X82_11385, partial [Gemmatimonadales bacterium]